jgi:hypothetical protein
MAKKNSTKNTTPKTSKKPDVKQEALPSGMRRIRPGKYNSFHLQKHVKRFRSPVAGAPTIMYRAIKLLLTNWKLFGGIMSIYLILELILVQGLSLITSGGTLGQTKQLLDGVTNIASTSASLFLLLVGNGTGNSSSSAYQFFLLLMISLVLIWALRQRYLDGFARIRDAFYKGPAQFVPFFLVLLSIGLQIIPGVFGVILYTAVSSNGIAASMPEKVLWAVLVGVLIVLSCYYISGSIFALYIVTLNDMTPIRALRMAGQLVRNRRLAIMRKVIFLPVAIFIIMAILIVPFLLFAVRVAPVAFFIVTAMMVALLHAYLYGLYKELLRE